MRQADLFWTAVQFLTRLPTPPLSGFQPDWTARSARFFPLVGALVGGLCGLALIGAAQVWGGALPSLLAVAAGVLLTGAFHEDGLADTFDGLGGGTTRERRLEIMKDSRIGVFGGLALLAFLGCKVLALAEMRAVEAAAALVAAHAGGRAAAVTVMRLLPYAGDRDWTKVKPVADGVTTAETAVGLFTAVLALAPLAWLAPEAAATSLLAGAAGAAVMAAWARRSVGGWVGDTLGAGEQAFETAFLLTAAAVLA